MDKFSTYKFIRYRVVNINAHGVDSWYYTTRWLFLAKLIAWCSVKLELFQSHYHIEEDRLYYGRFDLSTYRVVGLYKH